jgi:hypothetical protein
MSVLLQLENDRLSLGGSRIRFSVALVGIFAQPLLSASGLHHDAIRSTRTALASLLPAVLLLILSAYLYSESGGSVDGSLQLVLAGIAGEALAAGAVLTFLRSP